MFGTLYYVYGIQMFRKGEFKKITIRPPCQDIMLQQYQTNV
jgi:hypothetical protein